MDIPEGFTEQEVLSIIDNVVDVISPPFSFGYYDLDDIKQEGRIFALEVLYRFDSSKTRSLYAFLYTHIKRRLLNLRRDKFFRNVLPCLSCPHYSSECSVYLDKLECPRYNEWRNLNTTKKNLLTPSRIDSTVCEQNAYEVDFAEEIDKADILEFVDKHLPANLRRDYLCWREGTRIPKQRVEKVEAEVKRILSFYNKFSS